MRDIDLFQLALGLVPPWMVADAKFDADKKRLDIEIDFKTGGRFACPECGKGDCPVHDTVKKSWRHLNFFQHEAFLHARVPRIDCPKCGVRLVAVAWARPGSGFTLLFEAFVMTLVKSMPVAAAGRLVGEHDTRLWRIVQHYVEDAVARMDLADLRRVAIDETAAKRGHNYVSLFVDINFRKVIYVADGKDADTVARFADHVDDHNSDASRIKEVCIDMSGAYIKGVEHNLTEAEITFDKFHAVKLVNDAVDQVRRAESRERPELKHSRYLWLKNERRLVDPRDVPVEKAARRLGLSLDAFVQVREELFARGFPRPDPTTGNFDLVAINAWMDARSNLLDGALTGAARLRNAGDVITDRAARLNNGE